MNKCALMRILITVNQSVICSCALDFRPTSYLFARNARKVKAQHAIILNKTLFSKPLCPWTNVIIVNFNPPRSRAAKGSAACSESAAAHGGIVFEMALLSVVFVLKGIF